MSLIAWYPLNGTLENQGLGDYTLTNNGATVNSNGKIGSCYSFDGIDDYIDLGAMSLPMKEVTFSIWAKWSAWNNMGRLFDLGTAADGAGHSILLTTNTTGSLLLAGRFNGGSLPDTSIATLSLNTWYHIILTIKDNIANVYINGALRKTVTLNDSFPDNVDFKYNYLARSNWSIDKYFSGLLNDFRIYDHCLSAKEISEISKALILHYPMNRADGVIGGRNLLANTDVSYSRTNAANSAVGYTFNLVSGYDLNSLINKKITYSFDLHSIGTREAGFHAEADMAKRFGGHGYIAWKDSTGANTSNRIDYPFVGHLVTVADNRRVSSSYTVTPPSGYDTIVDMNVNFQLFAKPSSDNTETWTIGHPKLEIGDATPWTPAPEDGGVCNNDNIIYDASGYGNNGTVTDATCPSWSGDAKVGQGSYRFTNADKLQLGNLSYENFDSGTISLWLKVNSLKSWDHYLGIANAFNWTSQGNDFVIIARNSNASSGVNVDCCSNIYNFAPTLGSWYHISIVWDKSDYTIKWYLNGVLKKTYDDSTTKRLDTYTARHSYHSLGGFTGTSSSYYQDADINDFRIYATALSDNDVLQLYQARYSLADNGTLFCGEYVEEDDTAKVSMSGNGILIAEDCYEGGAVNLVTNPTAVLTYTPSTGTNSTKGNFVVDYTNCVSGEQLHAKVKIKWNGFDTSNTNGTFNIFFQGDTYDVTSGTWKWNGVGVANQALGNIKSIVLSSASGEQIIEKTWTVPTTVPSTYTKSNVGLRSDYSNGTGSITISDLEVTPVKYHTGTDSYGSAKIGETHISTREIIEN